MFQLADRGGDTLGSFVERMWVVVTSETGEGYEGILANNPASSHAQVERGSIIWFDAEHICNIEEGPSTEELEDLMRLAKP